MNMKQLYLDSSAASGVLHNVFYIEPTSAYLQNLRQESVLENWPLIGQEQRILNALGLIHQSLEVDSAKIIERDYYQLFETPGEIKAYPWGSVYTDKENLLMGTSTTGLSRFFRDCGIEFELECHQPVDHLGLILAGLSQLFERQQQEQIRELLELHLLPWLPRFIQLTQEHSMTGYYSGFAMLLNELLEYWKEALAVQPQSIVLYY